MQQDDANLQRAETRMMMEPAHAWPEEDRSAQHLRSSRDLEHLSTLPVRLRARTVITDLILDCDCDCDSE